MTTPPWLLTPVHPSQALSSIFFLFSTTSSTTDKKLLDQRLDHRGFDPLEFGKRLGILVIISLPRGINRSLSPATCVSEEKAGRPNLRGPVVTRPLTKL